MTLEQNYFPKATSLVNFKTSFICNSSMGCWRVFGAPPSIRHGLPQPRSSESKYPDWGLYGCLWILYGALLKLAGYLHWCAFRSSSSRCHCISGWRLWYRTPERSSFPIENGLDGKENLPSSCKSYSDALSRGTCKIGQDWFFEWHRRCK